jgi:two-component system sensor histidine kinase KdpD
VTALSALPQAVPGTVPPGSRLASQVGRPLALVAAASLLCQAVRPFISPTNLVMVYLLAVVLAAVRWGLWPAVIASASSVLAFDFFFVPPRLSFSVSDTEYLITFLGLFTVGIVISSLVATARRRAEELRGREAETASLLSFSRDLAGASDAGAVAAAAAGNISATLGGRVALLLPEGEALRVAAAVPGTPGGSTLTEDELAVASWVLREGTTAGRGSGTLGDSVMLYLPLRTVSRTVGVLGVRLEDESAHRSPRVRRLLEAFATQAALALDRARLVAEAEQSRLLQARENLERALANSLSHDLRTPLVSILGALGTLRDPGSGLGEPARRDLLDGAWEEAGRLNRLVGNLLDMTRLEAGAVVLKVEPADVEELVGIALRVVEPRLGARPVRVSIPPGLPLVPLDETLMTQVLVNLLENALKWSPPDGPIDVAAAPAAGRLTLAVADRGPGVPEADLPRLFEKFYRVGGPERSQGGSGLGLSICRGFVEAHHGAIRAENRSGGGLRIVITLPLEGEGEAR